MIETETIQKKGETYFLNLRLLLITTVFVGNAIEPLIGKIVGMHSLYLWIFTFHMPLFVLVTGYFAKSNLKGAQGRNLLLQIAVQYVIFQTLYSVLDQTLFHVQNIHRSFFAPYLLLWFLISHICWRLITIAIHKFTGTQQIALSLILGVLVGYLQLDGVWLSISRTFVYLPFFLIGYHLSFEKFVLFFTTWKRVTAASVSLTLLIVIALFMLGLPEGWLFGSMTYTQLGQHHWYAGAMRLAIYALQFISATAFLAFVPTVHCWMTELGDVHYMYFYYMDCLSVLQLYQASIITSVL